MTNRTAANRYARALLEVALKEQADLELVSRELAAFAGLFDGHPALEKVLLNPVIPVPRKKAAVVELTARTITVPVLAKLLVLLAERDRLVLVRDLLAAYRERLLEHQNVVHADVTTAVPLGAARSRAIEESLARATGRKVTVETHVDASIIGGLVARVGSTVYDGSVARQLERLKQRIVERV